MASILLMIPFLVTAFLNDILQRELFRPSVPLLGMLELNKVVPLREEREHDFVSKVGGISD